MKVQILGKHSREVASKQTGEIRVYTNLYYQTNFMENEAKDGAVGYKTDKVNTTLNCSAIGIGDLVNLEYGPTGYKNPDGSDQFRLQALEVVQKAESKK